LIDGKLQHSMEFGAAFATVAEKTLGEEKET